MDGTIGMAAQAQNCCEADRPTGISETLLVKYRQATINKVANGFIVTVGCQTFVSRTWEEVSTGLSEYYKDPRAAEKKYCAAQ